MLYISVSKEAGQHIGEHVIYTEINRKRKTGDQRRSGLNVKSGEADAPETEPPDGITIIDS